MVRQLMMARLKAHRYDVFPVGTGTKVLEWVKKTKPDAILLDQTMPDMKGILVCRKLKADPETRDIPVVMFTCTRSMEFSDVCQEAGAIGIINKPMVAELLALLKRIFSGEQTSFYRGED